MNKNRILNIIKKGISLFIKLPAVIAMTAMLLTAFDQLNIFSENSIFYGLDYIPSLLITMVVIPVFLIRLFLGYKKSALVFLFFFLLYFFQFSDANLSALTKSRLNSNNFQTDISVAAVNVQYYAKGFENVINKIKKIDTDVVLLTENVLNEEQTAIFDSIAYPYNVVTGRPGSSAIMSKYPILIYKEIELPSYQASLSRSNDLDTLHRNPHRAFLHAVVDVNNKPVNIISIRLLGGRPKDNSLKESIRWGRYLIASHQKEIDFFINYINNIDGHIIFGGDLNAHSTSKTVKKLNETATDAFTISNSLIGNTFSPPFPILRIDYLFAKNDVFPVYYKKLDIILSDHYIIYAEFVINNSRYNK